MAIPKTSLTTFTEKKKSLLRKFIISFVEFLVLLIYSEISFFFYLLEDKRYSVFFISYLLISYFLKVMQI